MKAKNKALKYKNVHCKRLCLLVRFEHQKRWQEITDRLCINWPCSLFSHFFLFFVFSWLNAYGLQRGAVIRVTLSDCAVEWTLQICINHQINAQTWVQAWMDVALGRSRKKVTLHAHYWLVWLGISFRISRSFTFHLCFVRAFFG